MLKGERYKTLKDISVIAMTSWHAPCTGGYDRVLKSGEEFILASTPRPGATAVYCDPVNYRKVHREMIPWSDRIQFWVYAGFYLCIDLDQIAENCKLVGSVG